MGGGGGFVGEKLYQAGSYIKGKTYEAKSSVVPEVPEPPE